MCVSREEEEESARGGHEVRSGVCMREYDLEMRRCLGVTSCCRVVSVVCLCAELRVVPCMPSILAATLVRHCKPIMALAMGKPW